MDDFAAILIGGPPHSGKSVLTYSLSQALRQRGVAHYVVRAAPDGEGDWANEAAQRLVRLLRSKGPFTPAFTDFVCASVAGRHLPVLVDAGGRPTTYQERIFACCTHAVLLTPDPASRSRWLSMVARHGLPVVADLTSRLQGDDVVLDRGAVLRGTLTGLERGRDATGPTFEALVERLAALLDYDPAHLYTIHERLCPAEIVIDLDRLAGTFDLQFEGSQAIWEPGQLPRLLDYLPEAAPLGLYGRGPNWLYAAVALLATPAPFYQFDARLGWVRPISLSPGAPRPESPFQVRLEDHTDFVHIEGALPTAHLDYSELDSLTVPRVPANVGIVLSGKLPHWLYTSLGLTYRAAPWIAVYQPQLARAIVVYSAQDRAVGDSIPGIQPEHN